MKPNEMGLRLSLAIQESSNNIYGETAKQKAKNRDDIQTDRLIN